MLEHRNAQPTNPKRVVVIGSRGVIGKPTVDRLTTKNIAVRAVPADELDLLSDGATDRLAGILEPDDSMVMFSALTPDKGRDIATLMKNLTMAETVCAAIEKSGCAHAIYFSSDAVYPFASGLVTEESAPAPADLYGVMHRAREVMFEHTVRKAPLAILRCTMVLSARDSHNSYGPNRFIRQATADGKIGLGGAGEEERDHICVDDVVELVIRVLRNASAGTLNVATGNSTSFLDVAKLVADQANRHVEITFMERNSPITYRHFDTAALYKAFPDFTPTTLTDAIAQLPMVEHPDVCD
jgi:UDP-glucose 4-epimerase